MKTKQLSLDALEALLDAPGREERINALKAISALKADIAQPVEPVGGQCRFKGENKWELCHVAHHLHVQAHPEEWPNYETRALYTTPQEPAAPEWMPIETASDQGEYLVWMPLEKTKVQVARKNATGITVIGGCFAFDLSKPTHWMPLPQQPKATP